MIQRTAVYVRTDEPVTESLKHVPFIATSPAINQRQRDHWKKLHTENFDAEKFEKWIERIPGCSTCRDNFRKLIESNPPRFDDWFKWTWEIHNAVNAKIGKPIMDWDAACELWLPKKFSRKPIESNRLPRVAFLSAAYNVIGGTETFHRTLLPRLKNHCELIGMVATGFHGGDPSLLEVPYSTGVESARILASQADVVVTWGISDLKSILPIERPKVISVHHADWTSEWSNNLTLSQLDIVDEVVCVNADVAERMRQLTGKQVHWIPNTVDPIRITPTRKAKRLRSQNDIPNSAKILLYAHRMDDNKQPLKAIEIAKYLPCNWVLVMAGNGHYLETCKQSASDRIKVIGAVDSLADWLSISERFISLAIFEGYGLSVAEALAAGVSVVSTPTGIAIGRASRIVAADASPDEWASAIIDPQERVNHNDLCDLDRFVNQWASVTNPLPPDRPLVR